MVVVKRKEELVTMNPTLPETDKPPIRSTAPDTYTPRQLEWFRQVVRKDIKFYIFYITAMMLFIVTREPCPKGHSGQAGTLISPETRIIFTVLFAFISIATLYIDIFKSTPAEPGDRKWHLLLDGHSGHFSYLTVNIVMTWGVYWPLCAFTEIYWLYSDSIFIRQCVTAIYSFAVFSSTLGTLLTLLFLQFNWFNASWRKETLEMYRARGNTIFEKKILFTHLNQFPIAFFDLCVLKQNHHILDWATPNLKLSLAINFLYTLTYLTFVHFNYRTNGGYYPYSFMDDMFKTWKSEGIFFIGLSLFCFVVNLFYYFVAAEAETLESFFLGKVAGP